MIGKIDTYNYVRVTSVLSQGSKLQNVSQAHRVSETLCEPAS